MQEEAPKTEAPIHESTESLMTAEIARQTDFIDTLQSYIDSKDTYPHDSPGYRDISDLIAHIYKNSTEDQPPLPEKLSSETLNLLLEERKAALEAYLEYHDTTGALVPELFHKKLGNILDPKKFSIDSQTGHISGEKENSFENHSFIGVSIDNLALLNTEGGHPAGDRALSETVLKINDALLKHGFNSDEYGIYHMKGSDFTVVLANKENKEKVEDVTNSLKETVLESSSNLNLSYNAGLVAATVDGSEIIEIFNKVQDSLPSDEKLSSEDSKKVLGTLLTVTLDTEREYEILNSLVTRSGDLLSAGDDSNFAKYYSTYVKKFVQDTPLSTQKSFKNVITDKKATSEIVYGVVTQRNLESIEAGKESEAGVSKVLSDRFSEDERGREIQFKHATRTQNPAEQPDFDEFCKNFTPESAHFFGQLKSIQEGFSLLQSFFDTEGVSSQTEKLSVMQKEFENYRRYHVEFSQLFPELREKIEARTNLLDETFKSFISDEEKVLRVKLVNEIALKEAETKVFQRDNLTGLLKKEHFYRETYKSVEDSLLSGQEISVIFSDLGNLRYTNDYGGRMAGNAELLAASRAIEEATLGMSPVISRFGGDEFAVSFQGGFDSVEQVCTKIGENSSVVVPGDPDKMKEGFYPHRMLLDSGAATLSSSRETLLKILDYIDTATGSKLFNPEDEKRLLEIHQKIDAGITENLKDDEDFKFYAKTVTRLMVKQADFSVDYVKGYSKLLDLYDMYKSEDKEVKKALKIRWAYSQKSLGGADIKVLKQIEDELESKGHPQITPEIYKKYFSGAEVGEEREEVTFKRILDDYIKEKI